MPSHLLYKNVIGITHLLKFLEYLENKIKFTLAFYFQLQHYIINDGKMARVKPAKWLDVEDMKLTPTKEEMYKLKE
jgi:hypothetical protein